jgi:hypothetical protein
MADVADENILEDASQIGVLHVGPPDSASVYAYITRENHGYAGYAARDWSSLDVDYSTLVDDRKHLRRHRNGVPLVVDVTHVGKHFMRYLQQSGIDDCEPVITFGDRNREPLTFRNPDSGLWHVSEQEAISTLHLIHGEDRISFGRRGVNPGQKEEFSNRMEGFGTTETGEDEALLWPLALACLIAEREESVIPS